MNSLPFNPEKKEREKLKDVYEFSSLKQSVGAPLGSLSEGRKVLPHSIERQRRLKIHPSTAP